MSDASRDSEGDPRPAPIDSDLARPAVAARASGRGVWLSVGAAVVLGLIVLVTLVSRRGATPEAASRVAPAATIAAPPPPPELAFAEAAGRSPVYAPTAPPTGPIVATPGFAPPLAVGGVNPEIAASELAQRRRAPSLVVDLAEPAGSAGPGVGNQAIGGPAAQGGSGGGLAGRLGPQLSGDEQFSERIGASQPDHAEATHLRNPGTVVPQGTMIPAVLETAMNSDLPGFVRAVVSRDVRGFDGKGVLIPRGSRLVGQYRSGLSQGASRIFVIWTRVLRPDGASVQIGSPGGDPLGRAGQEGKVHSHFFRQFATSILLSVINAEVSNLAAQPNTQIIIGGATTGLTSSATPYAGGQGAGSAGSQGTTLIPPTITVLQGAPISIFVARDLDFAAVGSVAK